MHILLIGDNSYVNTFIEQLIADNRNAIHIEQKGHISVLFEEEADSYTNNADLIILDFSAYGTSKILDKIERVNRLLPYVPVLVIHDYEQPSLVKPLWNKGVDGYVPSDRLNEELLPALTSIIEGERYISSDLLRD